MKIKPTSWHYRLVKWANHYDSNISGHFHLCDYIQLCPYVRRICYILFELFFKGVVITIATVIFSFFLFEPFLYFYFGLFEYPPELLIFTVMAWTVVGFLLFLIVGKLDTKYNIDINLFNREYIDPNFPPTKEPNIFALYVQALHDKVCPTIEVDTQP